MARPDPPPENPYASPQAGDVPEVQENLRKDIVRLQRELRRMRFYCHLSGGMFVGIFVTLVLVKLIPLPDEGITIVAFYGLVMSCANLLAFTYVIVTTWQIRGPLVGLSYAVLMALLGCVLVIGYFVVPIIIQADFDRQYAQMLEPNAD